MQRASSFAKALKCSVSDVNLLLVGLGLQEKKRGKYRPTEKGEALCRSHSGKGTRLKYLEWPDGLLETLKEALTKLPVATRRPSSGMKEALEELIRHQARDATTILCRLQELEAQDKVRRAEFATLRQELHDQRLLLEQLTQKLCVAVDFVLNQKAAAPSVFNIQMPAPAAGDGHGGQLLPVVSEVERFVLPDTALEPPM